MIVDRKNLSLAGKAIFEKLKIQHPVKKKGVFNDSACFLYFKSGRSIVHSARERVISAPRESVLVRCGTYFNEHIAGEDAGPNEVYAVHLDKEVLEQIYQNEIQSALKKQTSRAYVVKFSHDEVIDKFIESLDFYFDNPSIVTSELLLLKLKELILILLNTAYASSVNELFNNLFSPRDADFREVVQSHLLSNLSIEELADLSGLSLSSFKRKFKEVYQSPPAKYFSTMKMEKAEELLKISNFSINEICFKVGYEFPTAFAKAFKRKNGVSASEYRKQHQA